MTLLIAAMSGCGGGGSPNPVFNKLSFTTNENVPLQGQLTATDPGGSALTFTQTGKPTSGTVSGFTTAGAFVYQPNANFTGSDSFGVQASDAAGHVSMGTVSITVTVDHPPTAGNTIVRADGAALASINVLANAKDPDNDKLTVTITAQPPSGLGTAAVNSDGTVAITGLPSGFKGLTTFAYQVADPSNMTATADAAIFVGAAPFRAAFVGDASANGSNEVYLTDFAASPVAVSAASQGTQRLKGFDISDNGKTVVYRSQDSSSGSSSLAFVQTAAPTQATAITLPTGVAPVQDAAGADQFRVSPDGQWIALVAGSGGQSSLYVLNVSSPATVTQVAPSGALYAGQLSFTPDSQSVYFLSSPLASGVNRSLYYVSLGTLSTTTLISVQSVVGSNDDVLAYEVEQSQAGILIEANRRGRLGLFYVNPATPAVESPVSNIAAGDVLSTSTITLPPGSGGSADGSRVAYTTKNVLTSAVNTYIAEVAATPNPRLVAAGATIIGLRPDAQALLYTKNSQIFENVIDSGTADQPVGVGTSGWYDSTGNIVLVGQVAGSAPFYSQLAATQRGQFPNTQLVDNAANPEYYLNITGFDRAVAIVGAGTPGGASPGSVTLSFVNALVPGTLVPLASFKSPLQLSSDVVKVVTQ